MLSFLLGICIVEPENGVVYRLQSVENNRDLQPPQASALQFATKNGWVSQIPNSNYKKARLAGFFDAYRA